jgi:hypothetical protein
MNTNVKEMTVVELKALAYDVLAVLENAQNNLKVINGEIAERNKVPQVTSETTASEVVEEKKEE